jgi:mono/diheme cytochrome c family protein
MKAVKGSEKYDPAGLRARCSIRSRFAALLCLLAFGTGLSACGDATGQRVADGRHVYLRECARCHVTNGRGYPGVYPNLAGNPIVKLDSPEPVIQIVTEGREAMPAFGGQIPEQQLAAVISYIRHAWGNGASAVTPSQVK